MTDANSPVLLAPPEPTPKIKKSLEHLESTPEPNVGLLSRREPNMANCDTKDRRDVSTSSKRNSTALSRKPSPTNHAADSGSATESEDDPSIQPSKPTPESGAAGADQQPDVRMRSATPSREASSRPGGSRSRRPSNAPPSDTDSSPVRPIKKSKPRVPSSDEDSEEERKKLAAQIRRGTASASALGLRQPIKRGGRLF